MPSRRTFLARLGSAAAAALLACPSWLAAPKDSGASRLASDPLRPQFHLLPRANWMNDPCGPIWTGGRYHMFFQYNPDGAYWGDMHWAHATSADMVHWRHEPVALAPTPDGYDRDGVFSGCAVLDRSTPTILYTGVEPPASPAEATLRDGVHTWREVQCLAVSHDGCRTWQKAAAPIIANPPPGLAVTGFRDPCVWREGQDWMLALGSGVRGKGGNVLLYRSSDLRRWTYLDPLFEGQAEGKGSVNPVDTGEMWECPDFFPLGARHVLLFSAKGKVFWHVGKYEQRRFRSEKTGIVDFGAYYAARSMLDRDGNRILWGWIPERRPERAYRAAGWAGVMSMPRLLSLGPDMTLRMAPAPAVNGLRGKHVHITNARGKDAQAALSAVRLQGLAAELQMELVPSRSFRLLLLSESDEPFAQIEYQVDRHGRELRLNGVYAPFATQGGEKVALRLFLDGSVLELFAGPTVAITDRAYSAPPSMLRLELQGAPRLLSADVWQIMPISRDRLTS